MLLNSHKNVKQKNEMLTSTVYLYILIIENDAKKGKKYRKIRREERT